MNQAELIDTSTALPFNTIPTPKQHWLIGSLGKFDPAQFHRFVEKNADELGPIHKIKLLNRNLVVLSDPNTVQHVAKHRPDRFRRVSSLQSVIEELGMHSVFSAEGASWKKQRQLMNQAFTPRQIEIFLPLLQKLTARLCAQISGQQNAIDLQALFQRYTMDTTANLAFGYDICALEQTNSELQKHLNVLFPMINDRTKSPLPYWRWFKMAKDKELDRALIFVRDRVAEFIQTARAALVQDPTPKNILQAMIVAKDATGNTFSEQELFGNAITLLLAGEDTTANTLAWSIHHLLDRPDLQEALYQEIQTHYPEQDGMSVKLLERFNLCSAVIQEALRLKPVAPFLFLESYQDESLHGYLVPKGTTLVALLSHASNNEHLFEQASVFEPQRWLDFNAQQRKQCATHLMPFGAGARLCPGRQLALVELKLALIEMLRTFKFTRHPDHTHVKEIFAFTVLPKGLIVNAHTRQ